MHTGWGNVFRGDLWNLLACCSSNGKIKRQTPKLSWLVDINIRGKTRIVYILFSSWAVPERVHRVSQLGMFVPQALNSTTSPAWSYMYGLETAPVSEGKSVWIDVLVKWMHVRYEVAQHCILFCEAQRIHAHMESLLRFILSWANCELKLIRNSF